MRAWTIIIPVKDTTIAKTRLSGLSQPVRATLALAFALDAAAAALGCRDGPRCHCGDQRPEGSDIPWPSSAHTSSPTSRTPGSTPHWSTAVRVVRRERSACGSCRSISETCQPCVRRISRRPSPPVQRTLAGSSPTPTGPGRPCSPPPTGTRSSPLFGVGSAAAHARSGAIDLVEPGLQRLRRDVDTEDHLWQAVRLGVGQLTEWPWPISRSRASPGALACGPMQATVLTFDAATGRGPSWLTTARSQPSAPMPSRAGGLRLLRPGQRVRLGRSDARTRGRAITVITPVPCHTTQKGPGPRRSSPFRVQVR